MSIAEASQETTGLELPPGIVIDEQRLAEIGGNSIHGAKVMVGYFDAKQVEDYSFYSTELKTISQAIGELTVLVRPNMLTLHPVPGNQESIGIWVGPYVKEAA